MKRKLYGSLLIDHSSFSKATRAFILQALALGCTFSMVPEARGADGYEQCRQILTQDIFNKVITDDSSSSVSSDVVLATIYQSTDTEAYEKYKQAYNEAKKKGTKIDAEGHYGFIGGQLGIDLTSENEVSESEFREKFNKAKSKYQSSTSSLSSSSQNLASTYASYVRDGDTVNAWKECVTKTRETNLYAFADRDDAGKTYVSVMWVPGPLGGSVPSIPISFVTDGEKEGIKIHANPEEQVAMGSGRNFAVSCGQKCDAGFQVTVNGTLKKPDGTLTASFTAAVKVPPLKPPSVPTPEKISMIGSWRGSPDCTVVIVKDDRQSVEGSCDTNSGISHRISGQYDSSNNIVTTITRIDQNNCSTDAKGTIKIIDKNRAIFAQYGWNGCGVTAGSVEQTLSRD